MAADKQAKIILYRLDYKYLELIKINNLVHNLTNLFFKKR